MRGERERKIDRLGKEEEDRRRTEDRREEYKI